MIEAPAIPPMPNDFIAVMFLLGQGGVVATRWPQGWWMTVAPGKSGPLKNNLIERMLRDGMVEDRNGLLFRTQEGMTVMWENRWRISEFLKRYETQTTSPPTVASWRSSQTTAASLPGSR